MLTKFSKWFIYTASYLPLYISMLLFCVLKSVNAIENYPTIISNVRENKVYCIVLILLIIISGLTICWLKNINVNERTSFKITKNASNEMVQFILPIIISIVISLVVS